MSSKPDSNRRFGVTELSRRMGLCTKTIYSRIAKKPELIPVFHRESNGRIYFLETDYQCFIENLRAANKAAEAGIRQGADQLWRPFIEFDNSWVGSPSLSPLEAVDALQTALQARETI